MNENSENDPQDDSKLTKALEKSVSIADIGILNLSPIPLVLINYDLGKNGWDAGIPDWAKMIGLAVPSYLLLRRLQVRLNETDRYPDENFFKGDMITFSSAAFVLFDNAQPLTVDIHTAVRVFVVAAAALVGVANISEIRRRAKRPKADKIAPPPDDTPEP